jgi:putative ABC transport system permease protein
MTRPRLGMTAATILTRVLLRLYPPSFRHDVGQAVIADVCRRTTELTDARVGIRVGVWLIRLAVSLTVNALAAWGEKIGSTAFSWLDLKLAVRMLVKYPGLTLTGGSGIAMAIAIGVGFFAVLHSRFYPTIPLSEGDRLVGLENWDRRTSREERRSLHDFVLWRAEMKSVEDMTAFKTGVRNVIADDGSVESVEVAEMTPSGFRLARVPPLLGRTLLEGDAAMDAAPVAVISFDVWRSRFASAPDIVGRTIRLGSTVHAVVGVMPDGFAFPVNHRYWIPLTADPSKYERGKGPSVFIAGRLAPGFELTDANAELTVIGDRMAAQFPDTHRSLRPEVLPYTYPFAGMNRAASDGFWLMSILVSLLLVVVCVNVAILIYARTATRLGEIAVRTALGASRARIVTQLFAESLVLSAVAAGSGLIVVALALDWTRARMAGLDQSNFWTDYTLSGTALIYFAVLTVLAAVITGVVPALRATGRHVECDLRRFNSGAGLRLGRTWTTLIVVQVSVACAAIPIAVALSWLQLRDIFSVPAFPVPQILFARVGLDQEPQLPARFARLQTELSRRIDAEPGVVGHSFTVGIPTIGSSGRVAIEGDLPAPPANATRDVLRSTVDLNFFRTFDASLLAGRLFRADDGAESSADVVIVNRGLQRRTSSIVAAHEYGCLMAPTTATAPGPRLRRPQAWSQSQA